MTQNSQNESLIETIEEKPPTKKQRLAIGCVCFLAFMIVYVLLAGPLVWLNKIANFSPFTQLLEIVYAPLVFFIKNDIEPIKSVLQWYIGLFR